MSEEDLPSASSASKRRRVSGSSGGSVLGKRKLDATEMKDQYSSEQPTSELKSLREELSHKPGQLHPDITVGRGQGVDVLWPEADGDERWFTAVIIGQTASGGLILHISGVGRKEIEPDDFAKVQPRDSKTRPRSHRLTSSKPCLDSSSELNDEKIMMVDSM